MRYSDEEYVFRQDIKEKKAIGRGAFHKKSGAKSKKCTLPSDYMTRKEKQAMNGPCAVYDMKRFYTYEEFKSMPDDIQIRYLNSLINRYDVTIKMIAEDVFKMSSGGFYKYLRTKGEDFCKYINKPPYGKTKKAIQGLGRMLVDIDKSKCPELNNNISETPDKNNQEEATTKESVDNQEPQNDTILNPEAEPEIQEVRANCKSMIIETDGFDQTMFDFLRLIFADKKVKVYLTVDVLPE